MDVRWWIVVGVLAAVEAQVGPLIETHELNSLLLRDARSVCLIEVNGIGETLDPSLDKRIPNAKHLPMKAILDPASFPILKSPKLDHFKTIMKQYGVTKDSFVVLYDSKGMKSAAMVWWTMSLFGRGEKTKVLNGGLPKWQREGYLIQPVLQTVLLDPLLENDALYQYVYDSKKIWTSADVEALQSAPQPFVQVLDVRARSDFVLSSIKFSLNMPIDIITRADGALRTAIELKAIFEGYQVRMTNDTLTVVISANGVESSCAILALALVGKGNYANLDGGWVEYSTWLRNKDSQPLTPPVIAGPGAPTSPPATTPPTSPPPATTPPTSPPPATTPPTSPPPATTPPTSPPPATTPPTSPPPATTPPTSPPPTTTPPTSPPASIPPPASPPAANTPAATPPTANTPTPSPPVASTPPTSPSAVPTTTPPPTSVPPAAPAAATTPPGPKPTSLAQQTCDPSCSLSCFRNYGGNLSECWESCACPLSSLSETRGVLGLPKSQPETDLFNEFLRCSETCDVICKSKVNGDRLCKDRCAFGFCYKSLESPLSLSSPSSHYSFLPALLVTVSLLLYYGIGVLHRQAQGSLLDKWV